jgi:hypothetical protein
MGRRSLLGGGVRPRSERERPLSRSGNFNREWGRGSVLIHMPTSAWNSVAPLSSSAAKARASVIGATGFLVRW